MNDSSDPRTKLLVEALHGDWADGPAAAMARRAAAHARQRRAAGRTLATLGAVATLVAAILVAQSRRTPAPAPIATHPLPPAVATHPGYEIISDDELVALLRDRPLLVLPEQNGEKKIVLLDR